MAETRRWLRNAGDGSHPLAEDKESRLAARDLTLAIATFIWTGQLCASYDRLIPFSFLILIVLCHSDRRHWKALAWGASD
jgi:hypothetical protein